MLLSNISLIIYRVEMTITSPHQNSTILCRFHLGAKFLGQSACARHRASIKRIPTKGWVGLADEIRWKACRKEAKNSISEVPHLSSGFFFGLLKLHFDRMGSFSVPHCNYHIADVPCAHSRTSAHASHCTTLPSTSSRTRTCQHQVLSWRRNALVSSQIQLKSQILQQVPAVPSAL